MTIMCTGISASVCIGVPIAGKLMIYHDKNGDRRVDPSEWVNMGELYEDVRFSDSIYKWDGEKLVPKVAYAGATTAPSSTIKFTQDDIDRAYARGVEEGKKIMIRQLGPRINEILMLLTI